MSERKVALITAGTAGLGAQVARTLAPDYNVVVNYASNFERANALVSELAAIPSTTDTSISSPRFAAIQADIGDRKAIQSLVEQTISRFHRLDVIVSNAGWTRFTNFMNLDEGMDEESWDRCWTYNVKAHLWLLHAGREELEKTEGAFITTASLAGVKAGGSSLPYSVTKAALIHLSKSLAVICGPKIRCNSISPGILLTEWGMKFSEEKREAAKEASKLKRLPTVEDCAAAIRMLAENRTMTGQNLVLDSGTTL